MTGVALAINASAGSPSYAARAFRNAQSSLLQWGGDPLGGVQGIRPMGGTAIVTLSGSTITINLHSGNITPGWASATSTYQVALTATETQTLTVADATNPRKDIVIGRVYDHDESASGLRLYRSEYIAGVAGPGPSEPTVPQGAIRLATIDVPQSGGGSPAVTINNLMTVATGGLLPVRSQAERALLTPFDGFAIYRRDRDWVEVYDGAAWRVQGMAVCTSVADRTSAVTSPYNGQKSFTTDQGIEWVFSFGQWRQLPYQMFAQLRRDTTVQSIPNATYTALNFNVEDYDTHGAHDNVTNNSRFTCPMAGILRLDGAVGYSANASGFRALIWSKNGTRLPGTQVADLAITGGKAMQVSARPYMVTVAAADYIELITYQDSGAALDTSISADEQSSMTVTYVGT